MTDQPPANPAPAPSGERSVVIAFDGPGRIVSRREDYPVGGAVEGPGQCHYDEHGRVVRVTQAFHGTLINPGTP